MKLNNKGFAISSVMYALLILAVSLMFGIIAVLVSRKMTLDKIKDDVKKDINGEIINVPSEYKGVEDKTYQIGDEILYAGLVWQVIENNDNDVVVVLNKSIKLNATGINFDNYKEALHNWVNSNAILSLGVKNGYLLSMNFSDGLANYTDYVRVMSASDIYGTNPVPTEYSIDKSVINDCNICNIKSNYMLLTRISSSEALSVKYDTDNLLNYLSKNTSIGKIRPVIKIAKIS